MQYYQFLLMSFKGDTFRMLQIYRNRFDNYRLDRGQMSEVNLRITSSNDPDHFRSDEWGELLCIFKRKLTGQRTFVLHKIVVPSSLLKRTARLPRIT